jgi:hypothetical protein
MTRPPYDGFALSRLSPRCATDGARPGAAKTEKAKAKSDGEDLLTPLVQRAAEAIVVAATKK